MKFAKQVLGIATLTATLLSGTAHAANLPVYSHIIDFNSPACFAFGDFVSCSAPALNVLNGLSANSQETTGYVIPTPQGALDNYIVLNAGGAAALDNQDTTPTGGAVDNGFKSNTGGDNYFLMGTNATEASGGGTPLGDTTGTWDVSIQWLLDSLTFGGVRHDMLIGYDYNQPQNGLGSLDIWSLVTVRDIDGGKSNVVFELNNTGNPAVAPLTNAANFNSTQSFGGTPSSTDFVRVTPQLCVLPNGGNTPGSVVTPDSGGNCPAGYQLVDNAQSTSSTEFVAKIPDLNSMLENYLAQGYDTISVQVWMGCFGGTAPKNGPALADGGTTTGCDSGGFGDIFLLAGNVNPTTLPEPATALMFGLGALSIGLGRRRKLT